MSKIRVFISWGAVASKTVANALHEFLPRVIQLVEPWVSTQNLLPFQPWREGLGEALSEHDVGIVCLTRSSATRPWLIYETGAIAKAMDGNTSRVAVYLIGDVSIANAPDPIQQFQAVPATRDGTLTLVKALNRQLPEGLRVADAVLEDNFAARWSTLESAIQQAVTLEEAKVIPTVVELESMAGDIASELIDIRGVDSVGLHITTATTSDAPNHHGTLHFRVTNSNSKTTPEPVALAIPVVSVNAGVALNEFVELHSLAGGWLQVYYSRASGGEADTLTVRAMLKSRGY